MNFTASQRSRIAKLVQMGEPFHKIAAEIGGGCKAGDIQKLCWQERKKSLEGSMRMISIRVNKLSQPSQMTTQERQGLAREIQQQARNLYDVVKNLNKLIDGFLKAGEQVTS